MAYNSKLTVVDLHSGLGGRSLAFLESGFSVLAAVENDSSKIEICRATLPDVPIIAIPENPLDISRIPKADVLLAEIRQGISHAIPPKTRDMPLNSLSLVTELLLRDAPKLFLLQAPTMLLRDESFQLFDTPIQRRYSITYQVCKEADYSGFPVNGTQTYFVGVRNDTGSELFQFPDIDGLNSFRAPFQEQPNNVDSWYRKLPASFQPPASSEKSKYYYRDFKGNLIGSDRISINRSRECYLEDSVGFRRVTHNELAFLKGYQKCSFDNRPNRFPMYQMLQAAPDIYVVRAIAKRIRQHLEDNPGRINLYDWPAFAGSGQEDTSHAHKRKTKSEPPLKQEEKIIKPRNRITHLYINNLKCLKNLDIPIRNGLTAIMGVNGVGKSTILHTLACMFSPTEKGEDYKFNFFFTPTPDASWQGAQFTLTYFDENTQSTVVRAYHKNTSRWSPRYANRPKRDTFYLGVDSGLPEIEKERQTSYIDYSTINTGDSLSERIVAAASEILNKDYQHLTNHKTKTKELFGVHTSSDITYSSLSMGAGEQRIIKILSVVYRATPYSLILIDELDLLLHGDAQKRLIKKLFDIAKHKNLQIIFTTHSLEIGKLTDFVDIRYLYNTKEKTLVYDRITPDIIYEINRELEQPLAIYVEDDVAEAVVSHAAGELNMSRHIKLQNIGSAQNAFTLAAGFVIEGIPLDNRLVIIDGDVYRTPEDKTKQLKKLLSGTETEHESKITTALSVIKQLSLPDNTPPEKFIYDMLLDLNGSDELTEIAKGIQAVTNSHDWLNQIVARMNQGRGIILYQIMKQVSEHNKWGAYIGEVRSWLLEKREALSLHPS